VSHDFDFYRSRKVAKPVWGNRPQSHSSFGAYFEVLKFAECLYCILFTATIIHMWQKHCEQLLIFINHEIQCKSCKPVKLVHRILYFTFMCLLLQVSRKLLATEESLEKAEAKLASSESYVPIATCLFCGAYLIYFVAYALTIKCNLMPSFTKCCCYLVLAQTNKWSKTCTPWWPS